MELLLRLLVALTGFFCNLCDLRERAAEKALELREKRGAK